MKTNNRTSILIFLPNLLVGGAEETILNFIDYLKKNNYKVTLVIATNKISNFYKIPENIDYINLNSKRLILSFRKALKTIRYVKPDIVLSTLWYSNLLTIVVCRILNIKCIVREAGLDYRSGDNFKSYFLKKITSFLYKKANKVIAISNSLNKNLQDELAVEKSKIVTIYNPVESYFKREQLKKLDLKKYFNNTTDETITLVSAIRFDKIKFSYNLFLAIKKIDVIDVRLLLIGDGLEKSQINKYIIDNKIEEKVVVLGWTNKIYDYIYSCDLYISSSKYEGLGNSYLAAQLLNKKCLSSNIPASNEINSLFQNGFSFDDNIDEIKLSIIKTVQQQKNQNDRLGDASSLFTEDKCFGKYCDIFNTELR